MELLIGIAGSVIAAILCAIAVTAYQRMTARRKADGQTSPDLIKAERPSVPMRVHRAEMFQVESHKFVPVYLGRSSGKSNADAHERESPWATYLEVETGDARLCVFPFGVGIWHIINTEEFSSVTDLAMWRRRTYGAILKHDHPVIGTTLGIVSLSPQDLDDCLKERIGKPGYVFSLFVLTRSIWEDHDDLHTALRLLCCPTALQSEDRQDFAHEDAIGLELEFFKEGFRSPDVHEFGLPGIDTGYASWAGLSYHESVIGRARLASHIVEFEIAVQALWWFCSCVREFCLSESAPSDAGLLSEAGTIIQQQFGRLKTIGPTEPTHQRTMLEAVLATSRLPELVADTLDLYNQKWS